MSISTTIAGLCGKYNAQGPAQVAANVLLTSIFGNTCLAINELIETSNMTLTQKSALRGDMKLICSRAFRAPLGIVNANGSAIPGDAMPDDIGPKDATIKD